MNFFRVLKKGKKVCLFISHRQYREVQHSRSGSVSCVEAIRANSVSCQVVIDLLGDVMGVCTAIEHCPTIQMSQHLHTY